MTEKRIKSALQLVAEALGIWYGIGTPIPTNAEDAIKLVVALVAILYTGWKNHDFTPEACEGTGWTRQQKAVNRGEEIDIPAEAVEDLDALEDGDEDE